MDTNRSEEQEEASYSDDFECDVESQDSRFSEDKVEIKVFKSLVGSLTVQPKKVVKNFPLIPEDNGKSGRTLSELSLMRMENSKAPATAGTMSSTVNNNASNMSRTNGKNMSMIGNHGSKTSLNTATLRKQPLAQEKIDPHDIPASLAASLSSVSISRLSLRNRSAAGYSRGTANNIRRVVAHTAIKEKSYASAKYKTYHNPSILRGCNQPPLKAGLAKPYTNVAQRVASAKRMTMMDLKSKIKLLQDEIESLKKENRFLNHLHHRQDNALRKWEGKDAELPKLLNQHKDEIRSLQAQLKRAQQHARDHNEKLSVRDKKILRLETELDKLKDLVHEEHLQDRHTLQQDLDITRMNLAGAEKRIREYMRHVEILEKNHKHQLAAQERKLIKVNTHTYELQQVVANLKLALRNKDRMLNYIQMRSSGRTLIRAFHANGVDRGDEVLYGASIQQDLSRSYQSPAIKSHSFDFGHSRGSTPVFDEMRDYEFFSSTHPDDHHHNNDKNAIGYHKSGHGQEEREKLSPRPLSRLSQSLESVGTQPPTPNKTVKTLQKSRSMALHSTKSQARKHEIINSKSNSQARDEKVSSGMKEVVLLKNGGSKTRKEIDRRKRKTSTDRITKETALVTATQMLRTSKSKRPDQPMSNHASASKPILQNKVSTELIYKGSTKGFKYEGPFVNNDSQSQFNKDSTEILYSPKSDKQSERSLSSTCSSHTITSSRSEEIMSNIDILSARIRESCVLVPPPEETLKSPRVYDDTPVRSKEAANQSKMQLDMGNNKPSIGPAGDNTVSNPVQPIVFANNNAIVAQFPESQLQQVQTGIYQPVQLITTTTHNNGSGQDLSSPNSHQSFMMSPRVQLQSISLPSIATTAQNIQQPSQFQLAQPPSVNQANFMTQESCSQISNSPRISHSYVPVQTVSIVPESQPVTLQESQQSQPPTSRFSYFSFANTLDTQNTAPSNSNITIFQPNPSYDQQAFTSPRSQTLFVAPPARNGYPRVDFLNSNQVINNSNNEQSLPSINSNPNKNQPLYNPSYYVNLGSWK